LTKRAHVRFGFRPRLIGLTNAPKSGVGATEQENNMSFAAIEVPPHRTLTRKPKKPILTDDELEQIVAMLHRHQTPSDGVVYTEPTKSGKQGPRTVAYMTAVGDTQVTHPGS
jgi:hypothetical protein